MTKNQRAQQVASLTRYAQQVLDTMEDLGIEYTGKGTSGITFRFRSSGHYSSGRTNGFGFHHITVGTDLSDTLHVIRHELTHSARGCFNHSVTFFKVMFKVTEAMNPAVLPYTIRRESLYKVRAASQAAKPYGGVESVSSMYMAPHYTIEERVAKRQAKARKSRESQARKAERADLWVSKNLQPGMVDGSGRTIESVKGDFASGGMIAVWYTDQSHRYLSLRDF